MPAPGASEYALVVQQIEGYRMADLAWGTSQAQYAVLRFFINNVAAVPRTICVGIRNGANDTSIVYEVYVPLNASQEMTLIIPPCTIGTWPADNNYGASINFAEFAGTTFQTSTIGAWVSGNYLGTSAINNIATSSSPWYIGDVGFYADPNKTGRAPEFQGNSYEDDLQDCLRYWYPCYAANGIVSTATQGYMASPHYVPMRITPTTTLVGTIRCYDGSVTPNISSIGNYNTNAENMSVIAVPSASMTIGRPFKMLADGSLANYIAVSAR